MLRLSPRCRGPHPFCGVEGGGAAVVAAVVAAGGRAGTLMAQLQAGPARGFLGGGGLPCTHLPVSAGL